MAGLILFGAFFVLLSLNVPIGLSLVAEYILIVTIETGRFSYNKVRILEIPSESPMGTFSKSRTKNAPNSIRPAISSSPPSLLDRG